MPFPPSPSRMPSRSLTARRHRGGVVAAAVAAVAAAGCVAVVAAMPAAAASRERSAPVTRGVAVSTSGAATAVTTTRAMPRWATPIRRHVRTTSSDPVAAEVVRLVNGVRATAGCGPLRVDSRLATAARLHSEDMARQNYFSHTSLDGRSPWDRIEAQGYTAGSAENIAAGYSTPASVMDGWMNSAGHRANILNCSNKAIGVGLGRGGSYGIYWTQDFGRV